MIQNILENKIKIKGIILVILFMLLQVGEVNALTYYWRGKTITGTTGTSWTSAALWRIKNSSITPLVPPGPNDDVEIGDAGMEVDALQPVIPDGVKVSIKSLKIGTTKVATLQIVDRTKSPGQYSIYDTSNGNLSILNVLEDITIYQNSGLYNGGADILIMSGNFNNNGTYLEYSVFTSSASFFPSFTMNGDNNYINGQSNTFNYLIINGNISLKNTIQIKPIIGQTNTAISGLVINKSFNPSEHNVYFKYEPINNNWAFFANFSIGSGAKAYVNTTDFIENYKVETLDGIGKPMFPNNLHELGTIEYAGLRDQNILPSKNYGILRVSGTGIKTLQVPVGGIATNISSDLYVDAATLDIASNTLNRTTAGGTMEVANGATFKLSGSSNFPANFSSINLRETSTVNYYGAAAQGVKKLQYGHLILSAAGTKTFEAGETFVKGDFTVTSPNPVTTGSTINFNGDRIQNVAAVDYDNLKFTVRGKKTIIGSNPTLKVNNSLEVENGKIGVEANSHIIEVLTEAKTIILSTETGSISETETAYVTGTVETTKTVSKAANGTNIALGESYTNSFGGLGIDVNSPEDMGSVKVIRRTGPLGKVGNGDNVHRVFEVIPPTGYNTANKAVITLSYFDHENALQDDNLAAYWSDTNPATSWWRTLNPTNKNQAQNTVTISNVTPHRFFTLGRGVTPFPVEMISFTASRNGADGILNWAVAQEQSNSGFEIQASTDGKDFQKIGFVESKVGTSSVKQEYSFTDSRSNKYGTVYYRLKQIDLDGKATIFGPRDVNFGTVTVAIVTAHPNPIEEDLNVVVTTPQAGKADMTIHDMMGKIWLTEGQQVEAGRTVLNLNLTNDMPAGIYILTLKLNEGVQNFKLVKE